MKLKDAQHIAEKYKAILSPFCDRIEIAGSIRRKMKRVKDIEIVAIPKEVPKQDMFDVAMIRSPEFCKIVERWPRIKGRPAGKYTQRELPEGIRLDLFMVTVKNWGLQLAIRTGPANYSHHVLGNRWVRKGYKSREGMLTWRYEPIPVREEEDLFDLLGLKWVEPENRKWRKR